VDIATLISQERAPALQGRPAGGDPVETPEAPVTEPPGGEEATEVAALLRMLAVPTRLRLLLALVDGERSVMDLCRSMTIPQPNVSHHLAWLRASNLVVFRRDGKRVLYALGPAICFEGNALRIGPVRIGLNARREA
jgi:DNA-binding transcriptional ArsR family regulator